MEKIKGLDGIRAIAVILVIISHLGFYPKLTELGLWTPSLLPVFSGLAGVHIFFVLSGFLITHLLVTEHANKGRVSLRDFYIRRALRILPLYLLVVTLVGIMELAGEAGTRPVSFLYAYTFTFNMMPKEHYSAILGHTWSLAVEEHFYLVWPLLFSLFFLRRKALLFVVCSAVVAVSIWLQVVIEPLRTHYFVERWSLPAGSSISIGALAALLLSATRQRGLNGALAGSGALLLSGVLYFHGLLIGELPWGASGQLRALGVALLLLWIFANQGSGLVRVLEFRPLAYIGAISYGLYMWQGFFLSTGPGRSASQTWPPDSATGLVLLLLVAPLSYHAFEKPFLRLKGRFSHRAEKKAFISQMDSIQQQRTL